MFMSVNGKRKTEIGKRKTERFSEYSDYSDYSDYSEYSDYSDYSDYSESSASPEFSVFRFNFSVRSSQRLYVVYNGIRAVQQVLAQFLEELLAGTGLYV